MVTLNAAGCAIVHEVASRASYLRSALAALPRAGIADLPTPVERFAPDGFPGLSEGATVEIKRDDRTSALYGGNKVRKLDLILGEALAQGRRAVVTFGAYGSNHALATAVHATALGLETHAVLSPQAPTGAASATLLAHVGLGTSMHPVDGWDGVREAVRIERGLARRHGVEPCVIPMGGTNALAVLAYAEAVLELDAPPDVIYVAAGTLGTALGLAVGAALAGASTRVEAVRVTPEAICNHAVAERLLAETVAKVRSLAPTFPGLSMGELRFRLRDDLFGPGYAVVTAESQAAVDAARAAGVELETTYTGKALAAMLMDARRGGLSGQRVLFWDTYNSAAMPAPGDPGALPAVLREYIDECDRLFGRTR